MSKARGRGRRGADAGRQVAEGQPAPAESGTPKSTMAKLAAGAGALVVLALGSLFTGIGEGAANQVITFFAGDPSPSATPTSVLTAAVRTDVGSGNDLLALPKPVVKGHSLASALLAGDVRLHEELYNNLGAPVGDLVVTLVLTGHPARGISIVNIRIQKLAPEPVLSGTHVKEYGASQAESFELTADLDQTPSTLLADNKPYFPQGHLELKDGEQDILVISLKASTMLHRFAFVIDYVDDAGVAHTVFVDRVGTLRETMPEIEVKDLFALTGPAQEYGAMWRGNGDGRYQEVS